MERTIYIRMNHRIKKPPHETIYLKDLAQIIADEKIVHLLENLPIYRLTDRDHQVAVIDVMEVIEKITSHFKNLEVQPVGPSESIVEMMKQKKRVSVPLFILIWLLLFFSAALAIIYFHEDVSMKAVHLRIYKIVTGKETAKPLLFQIPYSFGLGLGMILFFNHLFKKRLNEEPSPLEVEMFNYQMDLDHYIVMHEKESKRNNGNH